MFDLVHYSSDAIAGITSLCVANSIAYLPYLFALWISTGVKDTPRLRHITLAVAVAMRLWCWAQPAILSDDLLRYEWEARMLNAGVNPYRVSPADMGEVNLSIPGYDFSAVYGPVLEVIHALVWRLGLPLKVSGAMGEALLLASCWRLPLERWLLVAWCPLSLVEFWMNGHNDSWLLLALFWALRTEGVASWAWLGVATLVKWWPALLVPVWLRAMPVGAGMALYAAMVGSVALLMPAGEWVQKVRFTTGFLGGWQNNAYLFRFLTDKSQAIVLNIASSVAVAFTGLARVDKVLAITTVLLAFSANLHPWYLSWVLPMLALTSLEALPWLLPLALLPLAYDPMFGWHLTRNWVEDPVIRNWIWSGVTVFLVYRLISKRKG